MNEASPVSMPEDAAPQDAAPLPRRAADVAPLGRVVSVSGAQAVILLAHNELAFNAPRAELGTLLKMELENTIVLALVTAMSVPVPSQGDGDPEVRIAELELLGELSKSHDGLLGGFSRGVSHYPTIGDNVYATTGDELRRAYLTNSEQAVRIGYLRQDSTIPAMVQVNELLGKHCAILGSTGTGKSCAVALLLRSILQKNPKAHVLLLDPHNEYASSFGAAAEVITPRDLKLPFWFLTFEEILEVIIGDAANKEAQVEILAELIPLAKARYAANRGRGDAGLMLKKQVGDAGSFTVDTPVPYRISDLIGLIDERMGRLEVRKDISPYRMLKSRIEAISQDPRYTFMFGNLTVLDHMAQILGRLFRVPVEGKPIAILELTGVPSDVVAVVVSVICRMTFDFALWGEGNVPITLVCEEAHRYVPNDPRLGFEPARRAIARIAKEGRKYGVSLAVVSQRPSDLDPTILSQCSTIFAMRLSNERDQDIVHAAIHDSAASLLEFLPSMGTREAIVFGDGVTLPGRIRFDDLPENAMPRGRTSRFTEQWRDGDATLDFVDAVVERWRKAGSPRDVRRHEDAHAETLEGEFEPDHEAAFAEPGPMFGDGQPQRGGGDLHTGYVRGPLDRSE